MNTVAARRIPANALLSWNTIMKLKVPEIPRGIPSEKAEKVQTARRSVADWKNKHSLLYEHLGCLSSLNALSVQVDRNLQLVGAGSDSIMQTIGLFRSTRHPHAVHGFETAWMVVVLAESFGPVEVRTGLILSRRGSSVRSPAAGRGSPCAPPPGRPSGRRPRCGGDSTDRLSRIPPGI
jgi:hypothetical protein